MFAADLFVRAAARDLARYLAEWLRFLLVELWARVGALFDTINAGGTVTLARPGG